MTISQEYTKCTECGKVTLILINPFVPPMCGHCGKDLERFSKQVLDPRPMHLRGSFGCPPENVK